MRAEPSRLDAAFRSVGRHVTKAARLTEPTQHPDEVIAEVMTGIALARAEDIEAVHHVERAGDFVR